MNKLVLGIVLLVVLLVADVLMGGVTSVGQLLDFNDVQGWTILVKLRIPRAFTAMLAGAGLGLAGFLMQSFFKNPLAGPDVLGVSAGGSLGAAISLLLVGAAGYSALMGAIVGSIAVLFLMLKLRRYVQSNNELLIFGILFSAFASAVVSVLQAMAQREDLQRLVIWTQGNFDGNNLSYLVPWFLVVLGCSIVAIRYIHRIEILSISDSYALTLGINPLTEGYRLLTLSGLLVGITTAICGPISFIGIAMPQLIRYIFYKSPLKMQFLWCLVASAIFALFCDFISNTWRPLGFFMPINAATALLGAPIIAYLLRLRSV